jgi:hypothetical protein
MVGRIDMIRRYTRTSVIEISIESSTMTSFNRYREKHQYE